MRICVPVVAGLLLVVSLGAACGRSGAGGRQTGGPEPARAAAAPRVFAPGIVSSGDMELDAAVTTYGRYRRSLVGFNDR